MKITTPFTPEQVRALNAWQLDERTHPFTCGSGDRMDRDHTAYRQQNGGDFGQLVATVEGWICPTCGYRQNWAHAFMAEGGL